jgi:hypothetical protein
MTEQPRPSDLRDLVEALEREIVDVQSLHDDRTPRSAVVEWSPTVHGAPEPPD